MVDDIDLTSAHGGYSFTIVWDDEVFDRIKVREFILRVTFVITPIVAILNQARITALNEFLQKKRTGADGVMPIIQIAPLPDRIGISMHIVGFTVCKVSK